MGFLYVNALGGVMSNDTPHSAVSDEVNKVGRPSQLTPELISKAVMYLTDYTSNGDIVPTVAGLACYLDIPRSSIYNYKGQSNELLDTLEKLEQIQESKLVNGGLMGDFNATIAKLMLSNHGYSEKQVVDNTSSDGSMKPVFNIVGVSPDDTSASGDSTE